MTFEESLEYLDMNLLEVLQHEIEREEIDDLAELIGIASDTNRLSIEVKYDAAAGKKLRSILERFISQQDFDQEPYEEMRGNFAYDAIAKDRASGY